MQSRVPLGAEKPLVAKEWLGSGVRVLSVTAGKRYLPKFCLDGHEKFLFLFC